MSRDRNTQNLLSVEQVAALLGLHVRTVRRYVRLKQLPAVRIGKQYRVAREALDAFTGRTPPVNVAATATGERIVEVSSIVQIDGIDADAASRVTTALLSAVQGGSNASDPVRVDTVYDPARARLKVVLMGSLATTASLLRFVNAYMER